jgi:FKBP-type peptidyl-prolyl cis-trans isomerase
MKKQIIMAGLASLLSFPVLFSEEIKLETEMDKISHIIGHDIGSNLKRIDGLNIEVFLSSFKAAREGKELQISQEQVQSIMQAFQQKMQQEEMAKQAKAGEANIKKGQDYLAVNAKKEGVKTTKSGLQYKVIKTGAGAIPKSSDTISAHYHGTLINGTTFDSSYDRGQPATFPVTGVIPGWVEALQLMNVGSVWELTIPSELAYGANPRPGGPIGPNEVLIFKIELLSIQ